MTARGGTALAALALAALAASPGAADAQDAPAPVRPAAAPRGPVRVRAAPETGVIVFAAERGFEAVTGRRTGLIRGGSVEAVLGNRVGVNVRVSRFSVGGQRVFPFGDTVFRLATPTSISLMPVELTGTYRFSRGDVVPYAGAGVGWHHYKETAPVADEGEDVEERFVGYHVVGGAELRIARWLGLAGEAQWTRVPDALTGGVAGAFGETDLGGAVVRIRIIIGP
jgi:hypothetical protein